MPRALVLLHGFTGSPESWKEVRGYLPETLDRVTLAPAALGHDGTPGPGEVQAFEDEVDRLAGAIRTWGDTIGSPDDPASPHLAGYSMGGRLALGLLVRHPGLFSGATLIGAHPGLPDPSARRDRVAADEEWARLLDEEGLDTFVAAWEALPLFASQAELPAPRLEHQRRIRRRHDPRGLARALRALGLGRMPDYRPRLREIEVPVRLVAGETDAKFAALADHMADRLPRATVVRVAGAGHNVVLERPEEIAGLLGED